ncbi:MAG: 16S rRNA pseudouridine(516) synthase [Burkholderiales bacterium PBB5]|nr:MAG: 16S rRNA pseudouridine(516) synthase [Burkholderiales bacterium PBB5]
MASTAPSARPQRLDDLLFSQGFGTRRVCAGMIDAGLVKVGGQLVTDPAAAFNPIGLHFDVEGQAWESHPSALVLLHKPTGYECSQKPKHWPSVMMLLPVPLRARGVQPVGRLDQDTTGLLLLTEDGALIHRLTSPKHHVPKVYEVTTARPVDEAQVARLRSGVVLDDDPAPVRAEGCEATGEFSLRLTLVQGKYHQVKRMIAAVGNHCAGLHRSAIGELTLADGPAPGKWRFVSDAERALLLAKPPKAPKAG